MKKTRDYLGILLAACTGAALLCGLILRTFLPRIILPRAGASAVAVLSLVALVLEHYLFRGSRQNWKDYLPIPLYAALIFGLFPLAVGFTSPPDSLKLAILGGVLFTSLTFLFDAAVERLSSGPVAKVAPLISAGGLFLALGCLLSII